MALEDDFCDIIRKARFGLGMGPAEVSARSNLDSARLEALEAGAMPAPAEGAQLAQALALRAGPLGEIAHGAYAPAKVGARFGTHQIASVFAEDVGAYAYALNAPTGGVLIDCGGAVDRLLAAVEGDLRGVVLTHGHRDHVAGLGQLPGGVPIYAHPLLAGRIPGATALEDGEEIFGLHTFWTPGHAKDMLTIAGPGFAFVGDTLFAGSLGRAESPGEYQRLLEGARRILGLDGETALFCGHGPPTRVEWERLHNAFPVA